MSKNKPVSTSSFSPLLEGSGEPYTPKRIFSIDVFRAITMVLMIFVNDFWSLKDIPAWLEHSGADQDFLGFSDIIFPCFLFIVGMSIPYAIRNRFDKGEQNLNDTGNTHLGFSVQWDLLYIFSGDLLFG